MSSFCPQKLEELRAKVASLTVELADSRKSHKRTVSEAAELREKERKQNQIDGEKLAIAHRAEIEDLSKKHSRELETLTNKTNSRIKIIEEEFNERFQKNSEVGLFLLLVVAENNISAFL